MPALRCQRHSFQLSCFDFYELFQLLFSDVFLFSAGAQLPGDIEYT